VDKSEKTCGAAFDRGKVIEKRIRDRQQYKMESYNRKGVQSRWMEAVGNADYLVGDEVYYFMFPDGRGMVLGSMSRDT